MIGLIICDIDGVLADINHRLPYLKAKEYDKFYGRAMADDREIRSGVELLEKIQAGFDYNAGDAVDLWLTTGRPESTRAITTMWLDHVAMVDVNHAIIMMRPDGDYRPSPEMKVKMLEPLRQDLDGYDLVYFIDDDPENVKAVERAFPNITGIVFSTKRL